MLSSAALCAMQISPAKTDREYWQRVMPEALAEHDKQARRSHRISPCAGHTCPAWQVQSSVAIGNSRTLRHRAELCAEGALTHVAAALTGA